MSAPSFTDFLRALDDSGLDAYEVRYLLRVWRRGQCWEKVENIAEATGMSRRRAYYARAALLEKGWLIEVVAEGHIAHSVTIPDCCISALDAQSVHQVHEVVHEVHEVVHEVHALPINRTKEDRLLNGDGNTPALSPLVALREHFVKRTGFQPNAFTPAYERDWQQPLERLLELAHGDAPAGCDLIDRALAVARGENERRKVYTVSCPRSILGMATNLAATRQTEVAAANADSLWQRAVDFAGGNGAGADGRLVAAIRAIGFPVIRAARADDIPRLKQQLATEYQRAATA